MIAFCWGGGLFVVVGTILSFVVHPPGHAFDLPGWWWFVRVADPAGGWWFLNLGRNLVLPTEALYHALFFACIAATVARQFALSLALAAALSLSHPFTGLELLAVLGAWSALEFLLIRDRVVPWWFVAGVAGLTVVHAGYYLWFLPRFPEHRQLQEQWTLAWTLSFPQSLLAYGIVAPLALFSLGTPSRIRRTLGAWPNRLLLIWLLVTLALENHDLILPRPIQPLHFTRGYSWVAFFLLGLPTLTRFFQRVRRGARQPLGWAVVGTALTVLLADNATWLGATTTMGLELDLGRNLPADSVRQGFGLTPDQQDVLRYLNSDDCARRVVVSEDMTLGYLVTVYTPLRSWRSHYANTPWSAVRTRELAAFFGQGTVVDAWHSLPLVFVFRSSSPWQERVEALSASPVTPDHRNKSYVVVRLGSVGVGQSMASDAPSSLTAAPK